MQHPLDELKEYIEFTDADTARLQALLHHIDDVELGRIGDDFYNRTLKNPRSAAVLKGPEQIAKLKKTMAQWLVRLLKGPHDYDYFEERLLIGRRHVEVNLPNEFMFTGMNIIRQEMAALVHGAVPDEAAETMLSMNRILDIELAIMLGQYMSERHRVQLEEFRELIVGHLPVGIFLVDGGDCIAAYTHQDSRLWARASVLGQQVSVALHSDFVAQTDLLQIMKEAGQKRREIILPRMEVNFDGDDVRSYRITVVPLEHNLATTLVHVEDLTETIAAEVRVQKAESLAKIGTMAAQVAHEVRNPLAGISGTVQIISKSFDKGDRRAVILEKVQEQIVRLDCLVTDLLAFSRPMEANLRDMELREAIRPAMDSFKNSGMGEPEVIGSGRARVDPHLLTQALLNLVQNAWQAGATKVQVKVQGPSIRICDDGPGIPDAKKLEIFEPFVTSRTRGTGLGLPVSRRTCEVMHGELSLCKSPLGGAGVLMSLHGINQSTSE
ncbi:MAG: hypothetical protein GY822_06150 [Deltaproteobacteria bacterium]|nr:hypothetical protein [Deltaproteobacteria bacterium]